MDEPKHPLVGRYIRFRGERFEIYNVTTRGVVSAAKLDKADEALITDLETLRNGHVAQVE